MDEKELKPEELESVGGGQTVPDCGRSPDEDESKPFFGLFEGAEKLVSNAERELVLPVTTLRD